MERYLGGEELDPDAVAAALKTAVTNDELYPVACGVATKNLGTHALLDLLVEGVPSPARKPSPIEAERHRGVRLQDRRRPVRRAHLVLPRLLGHGLGRLDARQRTATRRRSGSARLMEMQGKDHERADAFGPGDIGAVAKLKDVQTGDVLADARARPRAAEARLPRAGDELRRHAEDEGRRGQGRAGPAPPARGGPDAPAPPRPADRASSCSPG